MSKEVPKEPLTDEIDYGYICPKCDEYTIVLGKPILSDRCKWCGQKLDLSDFDVDLKGNQD